jgi:N-acetylmuramoyl-L-alanine amidase
MSSLGPTRRLPFALRTFRACLASLTCIALCIAAPVVRAASSDTATPVRTGARKAAAQRKIVALSPWEQAEQGRDTLEATPEEQRTRADYTHAMDAYRAIYHANPADIHAPAAINAVAELLAEQGRGEHDAKSLQAAVGQYEFLEKQYPASSLRAQALLEEARIEQNDLNDAQAAREKYKLLLKEHPKSEQVEEARAGLAGLEKKPVVSSQLSGNASAAKAGGVAASQTHVSDSRPFGMLRAGSGAPTANPAAAQPTLRDAKDGPPSSQAGAALPSTPTTSAASERRGVSKPTEVVELDSADGAAPADGDVSTATGDGTPVGAKHSGKDALVTGVRHWSTATYTRVAIDLGDSVTYEAARVPNPDRIYFDLHGTRLAPELVGKSFSVTDDGFLKKIRAAQFSDDVTRVVLDVNDVTDYSAFLLPNPYRLIIDIHGAKAGSTPVTIGPVTRRADPAPTVPNTTAVKQTSAADIAAVSEVPGRVEATTRPTSKPISAVVGSTSATNTQRSATGDQQPAVVEDSVTAIPPMPPTAASAASATPPTDAPKKTRKSKTKAADATATEAADATPARAAVPTADGETSLVRALGLKIGRIVIDAGHGGHDSGTLGVDGIQEKDVVLDVALRLGKLLHDRLGAEIIYTRSDDTFVPLETRTAIANKAQADLFLSIHANSSPDESARGVETYYLNFTSDPTALDVAARENAVSDQSIHQLSDLVKKIALKDKIAESREFAADVEGSLYAGLEKGNPGLKDRGVKKAPFVVLIGANMPSILAEISFVTNPKDASQLEEPDYRERVAESLYRGVARYEGGLSGTRVATERAAAGQ